MLLKERFDRLASATRIEEDLRLEAGSLRDYAALAHHHYRAAKPATATRVFVLRDPAPGVVGRYLGRRGDPRVVGVLVESLPALSCRLRDVALRERYGPWLPATSRAALLNAEVRCISRVVVDPRWRGLGLAVRLVRHALSTATTPVTEALAAMGRVTPFFEKAGMTAYRRPAHAHDARLSAALAVVGLRPHDLVAERLAWRWVDALPADRRTWLLLELARWHRQTFGRGGGPGGDAREHLAAAGRRLLMEPVYYVRVHGAESFGGADST